MTKQKILGANRANTRKVMEILNDHMAELPIADFEKKTGRVTYDPSTGEISFKMTIRLPMEDGTVADAKEVRDFNAYKHRHPELADVNVGDVFKLRRTRYEVTGYRPRAHKRPLLVRNLNTGKMFVFETRALNMVEWQ